MLAVTEEITMADVKFLVDDQEASLNELRKYADDELLIIILEHIMEALQGSTANAYCPVHKAKPRITLALVEGALQVKVDNCCQNFARRQTAPLQEPPPAVQAAYFHPNMKLVLNVEGDPQPFVFAASSIDSLLLGRSDTHSHDLPQVDLQEHGAADKGVSRSHATIIWLDGALHVVDNASSNGTFLDDRKLAAHQPYILHDGARLRLGEMVLEVQLTGSDNTGPLQTAQLS
jgi:hypothetical protein